MTAERAQVFQCGLFYRHCREIKTNWSNNLSFLAHSGVYFYLEASRDACFLLIFSSLPLYIISVKLRKDAIRFDTLESENNTALSVWLLLGYMDFMHHEHSHPRSKKNYNLAGELLTIL